MDKTSFFSLFVLERIDLNGPSDGRSLNRSEVRDVFYYVSGPSNVAAFRGHVAGNPDKTLSRFDNTLQGVFFFFLQL